MHYLSLELFAFGRFMYTSINREPSTLGQGLAHDVRLDICVSRLATDLSADSYCVHSVRDNGAGFSMLYIHTAPENYEFCRWITFVHNWRIPTPYNITYADPNPCPLLR